MTRRVALIFAEGAIANEHGDLFGTSPFRIIRHGKIVIAKERAAPAIMMGWRAVDKTWPDIVGAASEACDPDSAWLERTQAEREALCS